MRGSAKATAATGWGQSSRDSTGVRDPAVEEFLRTFGRLDTDEARAVFADHWIRLTATRLNETWPAFYELLRVVRERELYRNPAWNEGNIAYASFAAYFEAKIRQPFAIWAELEAAHGFVTEHAPELINAPLTEVVSQKRARDRSQVAANETTGDVLASDGSINPGNAALFKQHTQAQRGHVSGTSRSTQQKLDKLAREYPSLFNEVKAGRMSVNKAAIEAGFQRKTFMVPLDPEKAALTLTRHFSHDELDEFMRILSAMIGGR